MQQPKLRGLNLYDLDTYAIGIGILVYVVVACSLYAKLPHVVVVATFAAAICWWFLEPEEGDHPRAHTLKLRPFLFAAAVWLLWGGAPHHEFRASGEVVVRDVLVLFVSISSCLHRIVLRYPAFFRTVWAASLVGGLAFPTEDNLVGRLAADNPALLGYKVTVALCLYAAADARLKTGPKVCERKDTSPAFDAKWCLGQATWPLFANSLLSLLALPQLAWLVSSILENARGRGEDLPVANRRPPPEAVPASPYPPMSCDYVPYSAQPHFMMLDGETPRVDPDLPSPAPAPAIEDDDPTTWDVPLNGGATWGTSPGRDMGPPFL